MEEYAGVKFGAVVEEGEVGDVFGFLKLDMMIGEYISPKGNEGNMSLRVENGFLIKKTGMRMTSLAEKDVVLVKKIEGGKVYVVGGTLSSESVMHYMIYQKRKNAKIILHFHDDELLGKLDWESVGPFPYGSKELAEAVVDASENRIKLEGHGFVIIADDKEELVKILGEIY